MPLFTERLRLHKIHPDGAQQASDFNNDPDAIRHTGDGPSASGEVARTFLENYDA